MLQAQQFAWIGHHLQTQASFLADMETFWVLMLISLSSYPARARLAQGQARSRHAECALADVSLQVRRTLIPLRECAENLDGVI